MVLPKRFVSIAVGSVMVVTLGIVAYVASGSTAIESWVGSQLLQIGGSYLEPELRFARLTYVRPRTILLDDVTLTSPDPARPGHSVVILAVKRARLELTEVPRRGRPIRFSEVILESPEIRAIAVTPGGAHLVGFSHLVRGPNSAPTHNAPPQAPMKLSDFLLIRHVAITNGRISYDARTPNLPPIWLDAIEANLEFLPAGTTSNAGLYTIATTISRKPALQLDLRGKVDIDALTLDLAKLELNLDLQERNAHFLPSELQSLMKICEVTGQLHVSATGNLPLTDYRQSKLQSIGELTAARVAIGPHRFAVDSFTWEVNAGDGVATIRKADAKLLGGEMHLAGTIPLDGAVPTRLDLRAVNLQIQKLLRSAKPDEPPLYAGSVNASITFNAPLAAWSTRSAGSGTLSIRQGRIDNIPLLGSIINGVNNALGKAFSGNPGALTDSADSSFSFAGDSVQIDHLAGISGALAFRATGTIGFDRSLAMRLNAGPMERLQDSLGGIGKIWASVSDAMAGYRVSGTVDDPKVSMELGGGP